MMTHSNSGCSSKSPRKPARGRASCVDYSCKTSGRARTAPLLTRPSGEPWAHSDQKKPFRRVAEAAGQDPSRVTFYALRHSSIVRQLLAGTPVRVVADAHDTSVAMIERTYSRFISDHTDALLRAGMFDTEVGKAEGKVVPLRP
jgi:hypothetical protein